MMDTSEVMDHYRSQFARSERELQNGRAWTWEIRRAAISRFSEIGFPTPRNEEWKYTKWKYTNVAPIARIPFKPAECGLSGLTPERVAGATYGYRETNQLVFVNGYYSHELSSIEPLPGKTVVGSLMAAMGELAGTVRSHWARHANFQDQAFVALNTALMKDGAFIYVPEGKVLTNPIHLLFLSTNQGGSAASYPRNLIVAGANSQVAVVESYVGLDDGSYFTNAVTEIVMGENAVVEHTKIQRESMRAFHVATLQTHQDNGSSFLSHSVTVGGALVRNDLNSMLDGEGSQCTLNGLYMVGGGQHVDHHTRVDHIKPHCTSRELYKGVLDGMARRSMPKAMPPWGGAPKLNASRKNPNWASASSRPMPRSSSIFRCNST